jgi:hypothetical protein
MLFLRSEIILLMLFFFRVLTGDKAIPVASHVVAGYLAHDTMSVSSRGVSFQRQFVFMLFKNFLVMGTKRCFRLERQFTVYFG